MDRQEAERIYDAGKEEVVKTLLAMDARIRELEKLEQRVLELERILIENGDRFIFLLSLADQGLLALNGDQLLRKFL